MAVLDSTSLHRFLVHFTDSLTPELAEHFANLPPDEEFQKRLDELADKANEGKLNEAEQREYDTYIEAMDVIALLRVRAQSRTSPGS